MSEHAAVEARAVELKLGGATILDGFELELRRGELLAVVGPNGAGKSSALRVLAGDVRPTYGRVTVAGRPLAGIPGRELARMRAVLPQQTLLQFAFTSRDVVLLGRNPHLRGGRPGQADHAIADATLASTDATHLAARIYPTLSGGEQARVSLARVLAQESPILLLDEPTAALDVRHQHTVMEVARELAEAGAAVLAIMHDLNLAALYAHRIAVMQHGRVRACDAPSTVLDRDLLEAVFEHPLSVTHDAERGCPVVLPRRRSAGFAAIGTQ